jgi:hypothetical protein
MLGPSNIPSIKESQLIYTELAKSEKISADRLVEIYHLSRFDPRFAEILVEKISKSWRFLNPFDVNTSLKATDWPAVLGVLLEHAEFLVPVADKKLYQAWKKMMMVAIKPAGDEIFWIGVYPFAGPTTKNLITTSNKAFARWGFFGREILVNKASLAVSKSPAKTMLKKFERDSILRNLAKAGASFSVSDYINDCDGLLHRRTAELDIANAKFLRSTGQTQGKRFRKK